MKKDLQGEKFKYNYQMKSVSVFFISRQQQQGIFSKLMVNFN